MRRVAAGTRCSRGSWRRPGCGCERGARGAGTRLGSQSRVGFVRLPRHARPRARAGESDPRVRSRPSHGFGRKRNSSPLSARRVQLSLSSTSRDSSKETCKCLDARHVCANRAETTRYPRRGNGRYVAGSRPADSKSRLSEPESLCLPGRWSQAAQSRHRSHSSLAPGRGVVSKW